LGQIGAEGVDMEPEETNRRSNMYKYNRFASAALQCWVFLLVILEALTEVWIARLLGRWILFQGRWHLTIYHLAAHVFKICRDMVGQ